MAGTNVVIGFPNLIDRAALSGGTWRTGDLALVAIQDGRLARPARSVNTTLASTQFLVALPRLTSLGVYALINHNLSVTARWRVTLFDDEALTLDRFASGWTPAWPVIYTPDMLEFEDENWWSGTLTDDDRADYPACAMILPPTSAYGRYLLVEIDDENNPDGYIDVPRLFLGPTWSPKKNASRGMTLGLVDDSTIERARDGTAYADVRKPRRVTAVAFDALTHVEAVGDWLDIVRKAGTHSEVLFIPNPYEREMFIRRSYLGRFAQIDPVAFPDLAWRTTAAQIEEIT